MVVMEYGRCLRDVMQKKQRLHNVKVRNIDPGKQLIELREHQENFFLYNKYYVTNEKIIPLYSRIKECPLNRSTQNKDPIPFSFKQKGVVQFEPPPNRCSFQNAVDTFSAIANLNG
jgi:hypothetical protein